MATIDSLANETLSHIIEYLKWPSMPGWDNSGDLQEGRSWDCFAHPSFKGLKHLSLMFPENFKDASDTLSHIIEYLKWPSMPGWDNSGDLQEGRSRRFEKSALLRLVG
ncbi:hypothetical protein RQP46_002515 [Phenoliferia psychrophenolica]